MPILILSIVLLLIALPATIWKLRKEDQQALESIRDWAASQKIDLATIEKKEVMRGPYALRPNTFSVYRALVRQEGVQRTAWILVDRHCNIREFQIKEERA